MLTVWVGSFLAGGRNVHSSHVLLSLHSAQASTGLPAFLLASLRSLWYYRNSRWLEIPCELGLLVLVRKGGEYGIMAVPGR